MAQLAHGAVAVVSDDFNEYGDTGRPVALEADLLVRCALELACPAQNRLLDIVLRHALALGAGDGGAQAGIRIGVASALSAGDLDFTDQPRENLAPFCVRRRFFVFDCCPF